jgi:hypothetical protein
MTTAAGPGRKFGAKRLSNQRCRFTPVARKNGPAGIHPRQPEHRLEKGGKPSQRPHFINSARGRLIREESP